MSTDTLTINFRTLVLVLFILPVLVIFGVGMVTNGDPIWFISNFDETPQRIIVYQNGCRAELVAGQPGFAELNSAVNQSLSQLSGFWATYGLSDESLAHYRAQEQAIELVYSKDVTIHAPYRFGHPDSLFLGLSSTLGEDRALFGGHQGTYWAGAIRLKSVEAIQRAAQTISCVP